MLPALLSLVSPFPSVGFSGGRGCPRAAAACGSFSAAFAAARPLCPVSVGCALGVDRAAFCALSPLPFARPASGGVSVFGRLSLFAVSPRGAFGSAVGRSAFAARSLAFLSALRVSGGLLVSFPGSPCPSGLVPGSGFSGSGSGSWASVSVALGWGLPVLLWSPGGLSGPFSLRARFSPVLAAPGWFFAPAAPPPLSLF